MKRLTDCYFNYKRIYSPWMLPSKQRGLVNTEKGLQLLPMKWRNWPNKRKNHWRKSLKSFKPCKQIQPIPFIWLVKSIKKSIFRITSVTDTENAFSHIASIITTTFSNFDEIKEMMNDMVNEVTRMAGNAEKLNSISQETAAGTEEVSASAEQTNASMEQLNALASELDALSQEMHKEIKKFTF